jgi:hypothetical protein
LAGGKRVGCGAGGGLGGGDGGDAGTAADVPGEQLEHGREVMKTEEVEMLDIKMSAGWNPLML